jgi:hypothetical protein
MHVNRARVQPEDLSFFAGTPVRLFDPFAPGTASEFREFLNTIPMLNDRPIPPRAVRETCLALAMLQQCLQVKEPTYFVASNFEKTPIAPHSATHRRALMEHYGELLYPQAVAPVFASHADADVASMLSAATGLAPAYFRDSPGSRENFHTLFLLTEASHCGFLNRYQAHKMLLATVESVDALRVVIEAIGDYEAISAFRFIQAAGDRPVEADVLRAARVIAMFLDDRASAYTCIPALLIAFGENGITYSVKRLAQIAQDVADARAKFRLLRRGAASKPGSPALLQDMASVVTKSLRAMALQNTTRSSLQYELLAQFPAAVAVVLGTDNAPSWPDSRQRLPATPLFTLPGVAAWCASVPASSTAIAENYSVPRRITSGHLNC